jgi:hypothetical protein
MSEARKKDRPNRPSRGGSGHPTVQAILLMAAVVLLLVGVSIASVY